MSNSKLWNIFLIIALNNILLKWILNLPKSTTVHFKAWVQLLDRLQCNLVKTFLISRGWIYWLWWFPDRCFNVNLWSPYSNFTLNVSKIFRGLPRQKNQAGVCKQEISLQWKQGFSEYILFVQVIKQTTKSLSATGCCCEIKWHPGLLMRSGKQGESVSTMKKKYSWLFE